MEPDPYHDIFEDARLIREESARLRHEAELVRQQNLETRIEIYTQRMERLQRMLGDAEGEAA